ncbi:uncharacterized protein LOC100572866 [Acyrthosiphon pisum]|uniref:Uncharacterized protein n=1 Tax=Acyrthosiphon pisum TaxID=7029 RepID=A0A8R2A8G0_ACYPI|nr:uncharacterized protein LOC100572866 [Acyrthosiphon pisum]|eukprot:XP_003246181.1 PREDICTED: uncharacterized protein LOC100572866 [Acyrthosiphon pisum]
MSPAMALLLLSSASLLASVAATSADDCVLDLAIVCLDDKLLVYVNWLEKRDKLNVVGDIVTIVKKKEAGLAEDRSKLQPHNSKPHVHRVSTSLGPAIDEYFDTHTIRISLPWILDDDIDLELDQQGRGKKTKLKHLKKMMSMLGVIMCAKLSLMGPLAMVMIGVKALKALLMAVVSLTISKLMLLKKFKGGGGGGGGGGGYGSGSVVQADWSSDKDDRNAHLLAYAGQSAAASGTAVMSPSLQQPLQQMYPSYEPHGYHGAA